MAKPQRNWNEIKMTPEQCELYEKNIPLAYYYAQKWFCRIPYIPEDEVVSSCVYGLLKATITFDPEKAKLATYACRVMDNEILMMLRSNKKHVGSLPISCLIVENDDGNWMTMEEKFDYMENGKRYDNYDFIDVEHVRDLMAELTTREKIIIEMVYFENRNQWEIASVFNLSQSYISRIITNAIKKMKKTHFKLIDGR